jgi:hypothetical protein
MGMPAARGNFPKVFSDSPIALVSDHVSRPGIGNITPFNCCLLGINLHAEIFSDFRSAREKLEASR